MKSKRSEAHGARFNTITGDDWKRSLISARQRRAGDRITSQLLETNPTLMRNISFMLTQPQILDMDKDVTRRKGWDVLKVGDLLQGINKGQGLKPGEKPIKLAVVRVVSVRKEPLRLMTDDPTYGAAECIREGFPQMTPTEFVSMFCDSHAGVKPDTLINRIEFAYEVTAKTWAEFQWPPFVPEDVRRQIESFWAEEHGRGPVEWFYKAGDAYSKQRRLGERVRCVPFNSKEQHPVTEGRWVPAWNNIGRLILPDGTVHVQSTGHIL